jgi:uncharacterized protein
VSAALFTLLFLVALYFGYKLHQVFLIRRWIGIAIGAIIIACVFGAMNFSRSELAFSSWPALAIVWIGMVLLGFLGSFILYSLPVDIAYLIYKIFAKLTGAGPLDTQRREIITRWVPASIMAAAGLTSLVGLRTALAGPKIKQVQIPIPNLPADLKNFKIAQISDLHVGSTIRRSFVEKVVEKIKSIQPDLIVWTGDMADGSPVTLAEHIGPLAELRAPHGIYFVTGNHEYYSGAGGWIKKLTELGGTYLENSHRVLKVGSSTVVLAGVPDVAGRQFSPAHMSSPAKAMEGAPKADLKILLAHRPEICDPASDAGFDLQLSGHTHAGQFFPFSLMMPIEHKYWDGLHRHKNIWLYINSGTGYWGPPNRFGTTEEVTEITFVQA